MSGPQDIQNGMKMLGMGGAAGKSPMPPMPIGQTKKRLGDDRVPMSNERPKMNPGQMQDRAARQLNVPNYRVQPSGRPEPQIQAPPPPALPQTPTPMPRPRPEGAPLPPEINPSAMGPGGIPTPRSRPEGAGPRPPVTGDPGQLNRMVSAVLGKMMGGEGGASPDAGAPKPPGMFPYFDIANALGMGSPGTNAPAGASPSPGPMAPPSDPFKTGAAPIAGGPEQLVPMLVAAAKAKAEQSKPPVQAPDATQASPNVTPPVPRGVPIPPPPSAMPPMGPEGNPENFRPSMPSFKGYSVIPDKPEKGEQKSRDKPLKKGNNFYYYTRAGAQVDDNTAVAQRLRELREKAGSARTAKNMTEEEDRILSTYGVHPAPMDEDSVKARMDMYRSGALQSQIPDQYQERPPGVGPEGGGRTPLKLPPRTAQKRDAAADKANDAIQNPPPKDDVDTPPGQRDD